MVQSRAATVAEYLKELPPERRKVIAAVRKEIRNNLPKGYRETISWGMITYTIPLARYPETYNGQPLCYAALAAQKNYFAVYLMCVYQDPKLNAWLKQEFAKIKKKPDMGKSCIRFRSLDDVPLSAIGKAVASTSVDEFIRRYESVKKPKKK